MVRHSTNLSGVEDSQRQSKGSQRNFSLNFPISQVGETGCIYIYIMYLFIFFGERTEPSHHPKHIGTTMKQANLAKNKKFVQISVCVQNLVKPSLERLEVLKVLKQEG